MDIKWKKWKNRIGFICYAIGLSAVVLGTAMIIRQTLKSSAMYGQVAIQKQTDYQELRSFQEYITDKLDTYLTIADGTYINWNYLDQSYALSEAQEHMNDSVAFEQDFSGMDPQQIAEFVADHPYYNDYPNYDSFSKEEKQQMADSYMNYEKEDQNILYQITKMGQTLYTNMESEYHYGDELLPEYNYVLFFDGNKVSINKDGKELDIYKDEIYQENEDYAVPGYSNYQADESLKDVTVTIIAIRTPVAFHHVGGDRASFYSGNMYSLYRDLQQLNDGWTASLYFTGIGFLLVVISILLLAGSIKQTRDKFAEVLHRVYIEVKILVPLVLIGVFMNSYASQDFITSYEGEWAYYLESSGSFFDGSYTLAQEGLRLLFDNPLWIMILFWIIYLILFDLIHNHKKKWNGFFIKLIHNFDTKNLSLNFSKRQVRRIALLILTCTLAFLLFFAGIVLASMQKGSIVYVFPVLAAILLIFCFSWYNRAVHADAADLDILDQQIEQISKGIYEPGQQHYKGHDFDKTSSCLQEIQNGIKSAVDEQLKSERMKVDLVTNVSHDLKTPLTSIISYIEFLKEEDCLPEHVKDYIRILDEKSKKLNEMVLDVFSISKASSGQLPVKMEVLDFGKLLNQTLADMDETIQAGSIHIKSDIREHEFFIYADGQRMYRVCQNLVQNALKYSLEGSRMFINLEQSEAKAVATFKNTSKTELDQSTDFSARFVRGDASRTDGGSGLGLSIAKSFTEACGGQFEIQINGDMFIVSVAFEQIAQYNESKSVSCS